MPGLAGTTKRANMQRALEVARGAGAGRRGGRGAASGFEDVDGRFPRRRRPRHRHRQKRREPHRALPDAARPGQGTSWWTAPRHAQESDPADERREARASGWKRRAARHRAAPRWWLRATAITAATRAHRRGRHLEAVPQRRSSSAGPMPATTLEIRGVEGRAGLGDLHRDDVSTMEAFGVRAEGEGGTRFRVPAAAATRDGLCGGAALGGILIFAAADVNGSRVVCAARQRRAGRLGAARRWPGWG